jgi:site-specific recombinase XerD
MFLSKHSNGIWYLFYTNKSGKRAKVSTRRKYKSDALKFLQSFKHDEHARRQNAKRKLCSEFFEEFKVYAETNFSKSTVFIYKYALRQFFEIIGDKSLIDYTPRDFDFYKTFRQKHVRASTVNIELRTLRAFFNVALRWNLIEKSPFDIGFVPVPESSPVYLTRQDFEKLLAIVKENWLKEIIVFAVSTGLRRGELLNLKWNNVDMERKLLHIESSPSFKTKSGKKRIVPLNVAAFLILQARQGKSVSEYVFTLNGNNISGCFLSHKFKKYVKKANLSNPNVHIHSLRHTFASWLAQDGTSIYLIKDLLGHSDTKTTQIYSHLQTESLHSTVDKINIKLN